MMVSLRHQPSRIASLPSPRAACGSLTLQLRICCGWTIRVETCVHGSVRACVCVCARERARWEGGNQLLHTFNTALKKGERETGDAQIPPRSPKAIVPQIIEQNPKNRNRGSGQRLNMDEGIPHLQERQLLEHRDFIG